MIGGTAAQSHGEEEGVRRIRRTPHKRQRFDICDQYTCERGMIERTRTPVTAIDYALFLALLMTCGTSSENAASISFTNPSSAASPKSSRSRSSSR
jgi:hypothetical protein